MSGVSGVSTSGRSVGRSPAVDLERIGVVGVVGVRVMGDVIVGMVVVFSGFWFPDSASVFRFPYSNFRILYSNFRCY